MFKLPHTNTYDHKNKQTHVVFPQTKRHRYHQHDNALSRFIPCTIGLQLNTNHAPFSIVPETSTSCARYGVIFLNLIVCIRLYVSIPLVYIIKHWTFNSIRDMLAKIRIKVFIRKREKIYFFFNSRIRKCIILL